MSRLFEALQRSESERTGTAFTWPHLKIPEPETWADIESPELAKCQSLSIVPSPEARIVGLSASDGLGGEKFRFLAVRLRQMSQVRPLKTVLITSTIPEEGKSLISANLAVAFAHRHVQKILLLEGDLRRPGLAQLFGLGPLPGLCECLQGNGSLTKNVYHMQNAGFWFLPAGSTPDNPLELMESEQLGRLLHQLAALFDWIVIDSPPVLPLGDTTVWARSSDGVLLVVREGKSQTNQIKSGLQALQPKNLLGVILNSCSSVDRKNYYSRYYSSSAKTPSPATLLSSTPEPNS